MKKHKTGALTSTINRNQLQNTKDLNLKPETIRLLEENIGGKLFGMEFLDLTPKAKSTKTKINKQDYVKLKSFCTAKEPSAK